MNVATGIVDQWVSAAAEQIRDRAAHDLGVVEDQRLISTAFLYLCVREVLQLTPEEALDSITDGGNDRDLDAVHIGPLSDGEFVVTLFQSKYSRKFSGEAHFPENAIKGIIDALGSVFDPKIQLGALNPRVAAAIAEVRSLVAAGFIPAVHVVACSNGAIWNQQAQLRIDQSGFDDQVSWQHFNHDSLLALRRGAAKTTAALRLRGKAIIEHLDHTRVLLGRIPATALAELIEEHSDRLLERNIRRFLGLRGNRVNEAISHTLHTNPGQFFLLNNGLTMTCDKFSHNALQSEDFEVRVENLQIVNGGQTSVTIARTLREMTTADRDATGAASVLVRLYELPSDSDELVLRITQATNSQTPVDLRDLRANDELQQRLEQGLDALGYSYVRKRSEHIAGANEFSSAAVATAVLAVWRRCPHQAKFYLRHHFGSLYGSIFTSDLNAAQAVVAALIVRRAEVRRRKPHPGDPDHVRYSSYFVAMSVGRRILAELNIKLGQLDHQNFSAVQGLLVARGEEFVDAAVAEVSAALVNLYGDRSVSLQQLAATFRRADLLEPNIFSAG